MKAPYTGRLTIKVSAVLIAVVTVGYALGGHAGATDVTANIINNSSMSRQAGSTSARLTLHMAQTDNRGIVWYADRDECERAAAGIVSYNGETRVADRGGEELARFGFGFGNHDPWGGDGVPYGGALWITC